MQIKPMALRAERVVLGWFSSKKSLIWYQSEEVRRGINMRISRRLHLLSSEITKGLVGYYAILSEV